MNRGGRGHFTPSPRGNRGRGGGPRFSPSSGGSSDRPSQTHVGGEPSSHDHSSGYTQSSTDGSGERFWRRNDRYSGGRQNQMAWKQRQPVPFNASAGQGRSLSSARDGTDLEASSPELSDRTETGDRTETVGGDLMQSEKSDLSSDCTKKGLADRSPMENHGSPHANSSGSSGRSSQGNERSSVGRQTSRQWYEDGKQPQPVVPSISRDRTNCEVSLPELNYRAEIVGGDLMQSADGPLGPDTSLTKNPGSLHAKPIASSKWSLQRNERPSGQRRTSQHEDTEWVVAQPIAYCNVGISKPIVLEKGSADGPLDLNRSLVKNLGTNSEKSSASTEYAAHNRLSHCEDPDSVGGSKNSNECDSSLHSECSTDNAPFDICPPKGGAHVLNQSLYETNRERRKQIQRDVEPKATLIRSGMVLLKNFISVAEQVNLVNKCRELGLGAGGFYQPGYRDGAKLNLRMMCLGKNWDPETRSYGEFRSIDNAKPPPIPNDFLELVKRSIKKSHALIAEECGGSIGVEAILPWMSPDICLVNFYTTGGRLGLHQDRDEREESLRKGLPVVSISIGNSAEFLYGDEREVDKAEKITLDSGDVLIFGGESRHVFHGISSVLDKAAPKPLLKETNLRPGRLNLTFREY